MQDAILVTGEFGYTQAQLAAIGFLARYQGATHRLYTYHLREWCVFTKRTVLPPALTDTASAPRPIRLTMVRSSLVCKGASCSGSLTISCLLLSALRAMKPTLMPRPSGNSERS